MDSGAFYVGRICRRAVLRWTVFHYSALHNSIWSSNAMDSVVGVTDWSGTCLVRRQSAQFHEYTGLLAGHDAIGAHGVENVSTSLIGNNMYHLNYNN